MHSWVSCRTSNLVNGADVTFFSKSESDRSSCQEIGKLSVKLLLEGQLAEHEVWMEWDLLKMDSVCQDCCAVSVVMRKPQQKLIISIYVHTFESKDLLRTNKEYNNTIMSNRNGPIMYIMFRCLGARYGPSTPSQVDFIVSTSYNLQILK